MHNLLKKLFSRNKNFPEQKRISGITSKQVTAEETFDDNGVDEDLPEENE
jgi:hypothetical protein